MSNMEKANESGTSTATIRKNHRPVDLKITSTPMLNAATSAKKIES
jgi:hypothetical protein